MGHNHIVTKDCHSVVCELHEKKNVTLQPLLEAIKFSNSINNLQFYWMYLRVAKV